MYQNIVTKINASRTINMYEAHATEGKKSTYLHPTPGKLAVGTFSDGNAGRASFVFKDFVYFVEGDTIYRMDNSLTINIIQANFFTTFEGGHIGIAANEFQIMFVDGIKAYLFNTITAAGADITPNLPPGPSASAFLPLDVDFMDGSFILESNNAAYRNRFYVSALNDGTTWPILDFALINSRPTELNGLAVLKRRIFFFGKVKSEIWYDAGDADFRFRRDNNLLLEHGVAAINTISQAFDRLFYLSNDIDGVGSVMMIAGGITPIAISTPELDEQIQYFTNPEDATGFAYKINGQVFYQINFTADDHTFVFNASLSNPEKGILLWHELEMANTASTPHDTEGNHRDIANTHAFFDNKHFITTYNDSKLYEVSNLFLTNNGERIKRTRICRVTNVPTYDRITYGRMQVDMLQGVGTSNTKTILPPNPPYLDLATASDANPIIYLSVSEDGGVTYDSLGSTEVGKAGDRLCRTLWFDLGTYRDAVYKWEMYNAVPTYILGAAVDMEVQTE
jgi:hypothetical protein